MASLGTKALTILRNPAIGFAYGKWASSANPAVKLPWGGTLSGFRHFSEYWNTPHNLPSPAEIAFTRRILGDGGVALDIGANIGSFALLMAHWGKTEVHAFEPLPATRRILEANAHRVPAIHVHELALSDEVGVSRFTDVRNSPAQNHLADDTDTEAVSVQTSTIDRFCEMAAIERCSFIKIDVEGCETRVLRGAVGLLRKRAIDHILLEIIPEALQKRGSSPEELSALVQEVGYQFGMLTASGEIEIFTSPPTFTESADRNYTLTPRA